MLDFREWDNIIILFTATVEPKGMVETTLQDVNIRKRQYLNAIDLYLENIKLKILVCENACYNFFEEIKSKENIID